MTEEGTLPPQRRDLETRFNGPRNMTASEAGKKGQPLAAESRRNGHSIRAEIRALIKDGFNVESVDDLDTVMRELLKQGNLKRAIAVKAIMHMLLDSDKVQGSRDSLNWFIEQVEGMLPTTAMTANMNLGDADEAVGSAFAQSLMRGLAQNEAAGGEGEAAQPGDTGGADSPKV
jgi:hypothetical protein